MARWSRWDDRFPPYVPVAEKRKKAEAQAKKLAKQGHTLVPVQSSLRKIAASWWGQAWCRNLERYSDFANRLGRGRSYLSHGAVIDLQIEPGAVHARVMGSSLYEVEVKIHPLKAARWQTLVATASGQLHSLVDLLAGRFSDEMMTAFTAPSHGLFPEPKEIQLKCSCPDWATMCKHVAAVLYGVGVRLDAEPALLFRLRNVNEDELLVTAASAGTYLKTGDAAHHEIGGQDLGALFGIELAGAETPPVAPKTPKRLPKPTPHLRHPANVKRKGKKPGKAPPAASRGAKAKTASKRAQKRRRA